MSSITNRLSLFIENNKKPLAMAVAILLTTLSVSGAAYLIVNHEDAPDPQYWTFTQSDSELKKYVYDATRSVYPTSNGPSYNSLDSNDEYLFFKCKITFHLPYGVTSSMGGAGFELICYPGDTVSYSNLNPFTGSYPNYNNINWNWSIRDNTSATLYFIVPGNDASKVIQDGEFVVSYIGNMEIR